ncbi:hypothetical protein PDIG_26200 [Penicillium digitatum PHI26]|uniref:Uncharacterized protein n=2 Tax=Penicillium digitatum TaxID=36651 RepID=K9G2E7_PEND2|nr:hypothetical protein PDIP_60680 [Penicillium digitatum Pd1]EKV10323.1 hypothetical protein PDIP_60680 [Penicillium digitatum Pd1]EKV15499.1 hypothetical protein PDIG_26200 [Penicillium digitatum PHI26]
MPYPVLETLHQSRSRLESFMEVSHAIITLIFGHLKPPSGPTNGQPIRSTPTTR